MSSSFPDAAARHRIASSLDESLLVEAAAGTGKTTVLVSRLVAVLASGRTTVDRIVAVTFTRKAAGELKLRLRQALDRAREQSTEEAEQGHLEAAVARLEEAHIGTIHSFCAEILRERPVEAGVDPAFREIDDEEAARRYDRSFRRWIEAELAEDSPTLRRAFSRLARSSGPRGASPLERLRDAGRSLVEWRDFPTPWERRDFDRRGAIDALAEGVETLGDRHAQCPNRHDYLRRSLEPVAELATWVRRSEAVGDRDPDELEARLVELDRQLRRNEKWKGRGQWYAPEVRRDDVLAERQQLQEKLEDFRSRADADLAAALRAELWRAIDGYEEVKRQAGELDFLDLLLRTRDLLRDSEPVRRHLQQRFSHLFVDEFQDTDPLQAEILLLLAADDPTVSDWRACRPLPGKLFLVGDPKQSIYRFRRADVLLYQEIKERLTTEGGVTAVHLQRSFRSQRPIQQLVNAAFEQQMTGDAEAGQPDYIPLDPHREAEPGQPAVVALPAPRPFGYSRVAKTKIEACLPQTVGAYLAWLIRDSGWTVVDPEGDGSTRIPIAPKHVAVLFRRFMSWNRDMSNDYVRALEARGIPHLLVGGRSFYQREEVETVRAALTAIEWPDDELAVFATLRGGLFALGDDLLLRYRSEVGPLHPFRRPADGEVAAELDPVAEVLEELAVLHRRRNRRPVVDTVLRLLEICRAPAGLALRPAGHQVLANVQRICDLARQFEMRGGLSFRGFVERLDQEAESLSSAQAPVLEEGADGVRVLTAHAAKGLEFPVVVLADITANLHRREAGLFLDAGRRLAAHRLLGCAPFELQENGELELARDRAEGVRLAYVAATRARDLLVVPTVGVGPWEGGWTSPLNDGLYPEPRRFHLATVAPGCPPFGHASILEPPQNFSGQPEDAVRPGLHTPRHGEHRVVWWDPAILDLDVEGNFGLHREQILSPDVEGGRHGAEGLGRYNAWRANRDRAIEAGSRPALRVTTPSEAGDPPPASVDPASIAIERCERPATRPAGPRFGTLVHTLLRDVPWPSGEASNAPELAEVTRLADLHGRMVDATFEEVEAASQAVTTALAHPLLERARRAERRHRETPFLLRLDDPDAFDLSHGGEPQLLEGTIDLAFREEGRWWVVDFKTDLDPGPLEAKYRQQVAWYVHAIAKLNGEPAEGVLLLV